MPWRWHPAHSRQSESCAIWWVDHRCWGESRLSPPSWPPSLLPGWARPEGEGGHHGNGTLPNPIDRDRMQFGVGGRGVVAAMVNPSPSHLLIAGLCSHAPSLIPSRSQLCYDYAQKGVRLCLPFSISLFLVQPSRTFWNALPFSTCY